MKTKVKTVPVVIIKEIVDSPLIKLVKETNLPSCLASHLETWKIVGNRWLTSMEAELELSAMNKEVEGGMELNALRALTFMGYMVKTEASFANGWVVRYRLSKQGQKAVGIKEVEQVSTSTAQEEIECGMCDGSGVDEKGLLCAVCGGSGTYAAKKARPAAKRTPDPIKTTMRTQTRRVDRSSLVDCPLCDGTGMGTKNTCKSCKGTGSIEDAKPSPTRKPSKPELKQRIMVRRK